VDKMVIRSITKFAVILSIIYKDKDYERA
jgi:hypothetical protein